MKLFKRIFGKKAATKAAPNVKGKDVTQQIKIIADSVIVERNRRGIGPSTRLYK
jgi:NOL1/NOP2/fmu family ribosome biogenesis protein